MGEVGRDGALAVTGYGGEDLHSGLVELGKEFGFGCRHYGQAEGRSGGGAEGFGVPRADGAGEGDESGGAEGLGRADERAEVAWVLQGGGDDDERVRNGEDLGEREGARLDQGGDALWGLGGDGTGEDVFGELEDFDFGRKLGSDEGNESLVQADPFVDPVADAAEKVFAAGADEDGGDLDAAAKGFDQKMFALDADLAGFISVSGGEAGAQFLDAAVLPTLYNARVAL